MTKKVCRFLLVFMVFPAVLSAQHGNSAYNEYIEKYHELAIRQQKEHKIPASIILAQGILESGAGRGRLAVKANNHFGIKCHDNWDGARIYHDDDKKHECFRKYRRVLDSYEDHSAFLKSRSRYAFLFNLDPTDYKGWAHGLKKAGYATDPAYAYKLIALIDEYELHRFDLAAAKEKNRKANAAKTRKPKNTRQVVMGGKPKKAKDKLPPVGSVFAYVSHQVMKVNGLKYVEAVPGDTYGSIADEFGLKEKDLLAYNEMPQKAKPDTGERVYLQKKKRKAPKRFETHVVQQGESLYSIAQHYGIRLIDLYDMNSLPYDAGAKVGQVIKLRP